MKFLIRKKDQSRAKASLNAAERRQFGSEFSPLFDAFHPIFPLSTEQYISRPLTFYEKPSHAFDPLNDPYVDHRPKTSGHHHCTDPKADACHDGKNTKNCGHLGCLSPEVDDHYGRDLVLGLPTEVSDLIFSYLTPAALDAARHTCWRWRKYILRNNWVLSSVLDGSYAINTRDLLKKLDCDSDLLATSGHPDAWRTRFRIRNLDFSLYSPAICKAGTSRPRFVAAARCGTQNGFLVFQLSRSYGEHESSNLLKSTLVLYRFDSTDLPLYVGTIGHPADGGKLRIISAADNRQGASWILKVEIGEIASLYSITIRKAFSRSDSRFLLRNFPPHEEPMQEIYWSDTVKELERPSDGVPQSCNSWRILAQLPLHAAAQHVCFSQGSACTRKPRFLAAQVRTGKIFVIAVVNASLLSSGNYERLIKDRDAKYVGTTLLSPPQIASVFKNVAVAYTLLRDGTTRVGIVWRTPFLEEARSELYIYDIPEAVHHEPCASYGSVCSLANAFETSKHSDEVAILQRCRVVQGKRISSLSPCVGGTHPCSPIAGLAFPEEISLGGLQMLHTMGNQDAYPHDVQYQKCFVWGPVYSEDRTSQISFKIIDFSFADPQHLKSLIYKNLPLTYKKTRRLPRQPIPTIESVHCPCVLHDTGFRIILPCVTASQSTLFERPKAWTTWQWQQRRLPKAVVLDGSISRDWLEAEGAWRNPWFGPRKADCLSEDVRGESVESIGTISRNDTPARQSALQRQHQWLVGRIRGMKRESLNDFEIAELWSAADWTQWGQIRKPEGWRHL